MTDLHEYAFGGKIYIDLKEIIPLRPYSKGCNSTGKLIQRKGYKDVINGRIVDGAIQPTVKKSCKYGSVFVNKTEVLELFNIIPRPAVIPAANTVTDTTPIADTTPVTNAKQDMRLHMAQLDLDDIRCSCELKLQMAQLEISEMKRECDIRIHMMRLELDETRRACDVRLHMMRLELNEARRDYDTKLYRADMDLVSSQNTIDMLKMRIRIGDSQKNMSMY